MKQNTALYVIVGVLVVALIGGGFIASKFMGKRTDQTPVEEEEEITSLPPVDASVEVNLVSKADKRNVILTVTNIPSGTSSIEYELTYNTGAGLPKGSLGKIETAGKSSLEREILLGTCSKNTCSYDTGVTQVSLVLKFNSADGASQYTNEFPLE